MSIFRSSQFDTNRESGMLVRPSGAEVDKLFDPCFEILTVINSHRIFCDH